MSVARAELRAVVQRVSARKRRSNLHYLQDRTDAVFDEYAEFMHRGHRVRWYASESRFLFELQLATAANFTWGSPVPIVWSSETPTDAFRDVLDLLGLREDESLLLARNGASLFVEPRGLEADLALLDVLCDLADALPPDVPDTELDPDALPPGLRSLLALAPSWAIEDDVDRADRIEAASDDELRAFCVLLEPHFSAITALLDAAGDAVPDEALVLGTLAQAADEALIEVERRQTSSPFPDGS